MKIQFDMLEPQKFNVFLVSQIAPDTFIDGVAGLDFVVVPKRSISEVHRHNHSDNVIYIINGIAQVVLDGEVWDVRPGMRVVIPRTVSHGLRTGEEQLEFISIQVPPILDRRNDIFDREIIG